MGDVVIVRRVAAIVGGLLPAGQQPVAKITAATALRETGLSSLLMTRLWFTLRQEFGVDIPMAELADIATVGDLATRVASTAPSAPVTQRQGFSSEGRFEPFALTDLQQAYLVSKQDESSPETMGCHVYREFPVADLDVPRLERAWRRVVERHDMLRAALTPGGRQVVREQLPPVAIKRHEDTEALREVMSHHRYTAADWPMWTVAVSGADRVHLSIDTMITDGHGLDVLLDDWSRAYRDAEVTELAITPRECVGTLAVKADDEHLVYWQQRLADLVNAPGPFTGIAPGRRHALTARIPRQSWREIQRTAEKWSASPTALVLTLFAEAIARRHDGAFSLCLTTNQRPRLPREADDVIGPFTSTMVMPMASTFDRPLAVAVADVHAQLWRDLEHATMSGVTASRKLRTRVPLPVVFTGMVGLGRDSEFANAIDFALSQTSDVALDHQMWERDGELHIRWDTFLPAGLVRPLFADFLNALHDVCAEDPSFRALNQLQQAYYVPRAMAGKAPWDGCQVYHSFPVEQLDLARLEAAWLRLVETYDLLRTVVTHDGRLQVNPVAPVRRHIPIVAPSDVDRNALVGNAYPLGRGPQSDLLVSVDEDGSTIVHIVTDLTIIDGRSLHYLVRELFRLYAELATDPAATPRPSLPAPAQTAEPQAVEHWKRRVGSVQSGPRVVKPAEGPPDRVRREGRLAGWDAVREAAQRAGVTTDDLLAAALTEVFARHYPTPFSIPVVRWTEEKMPYRPGEFTALSWVTRESADTPLWQQAAAFRAVVAQDIAADSANGLAELRRRVMKERRTGDFDLPIVYTGVLDLRSQPLPDGVRLGPWLTCTPDVSLDCIAIEESDEIAFYWDAQEAHFEDLDGMFAEYTAILQALAWNQTVVPYDAPGPVHLLFEEQADRQPDAIALRWAGGGTMTFAELERAANRVAWALRGLGVGPEVAVGISMPRGPQMAVAVYGVLKAGGFYVPIVPSLPQDRAGTIVAEADVSVVLTCRDRRGWTVPVTEVVVDELSGEASRPDVTGDADTTAYVFFTSGSTGKPKGVAIAHRAVHNLLQWAKREHRFTSADVGMCVTSFGFDLSVFDLLGLLGYGCGIYIANEAEQKDPDLLLDALLREPITFWNSAPSTLTGMVPLFRTRPKGWEFERLRAVYLSGDCMPMSMPDDVRAFFPNARIINVGGATEATIWSNVFEVGEVDPAWRGIPYGKPIDNSKYYIFDERLRPVPVGVEGDLYIGGDCLATGYYGRPDLTAERFIPSPLGDGLVYNTGDRASFFPDGTIAFHGRSDFQVKIRGFRVELGEIEHYLRVHDGVKDSVVVAKEDHTGDKKLVAYVIAQGAPPAVGELRRHVASHLPDYMVPNVIAFLDRYPVTGNGKLDRAALPWPIAAGTTHEVAAVEPAVEPAVGDGAGPAAAELAAIFAEMLGVSEVDPHADIWDQGATSFTMVQVSGELLARYGKKVPVSVLLADPTVAGIAAALGGGVPAPAVEIQAPVAEPVAPVKVDFFDLESRDAFKNARHDLRPDAGTIVPLSGIALSESNYHWRSCRREYGPEMLPLESFSRLLTLLRESEVDGRATRLYPSAGSTYSVQVYLHIRPGAVEQIPEGLYYYHPVQHALHLVNPAPSIGRGIHFVYNRPVFDGSRFDIYLFGNPAAIEPVYGAETDRFMLLEAGYLGQTLLLGQASCGIGLCPIGGIVPDPVREQLGLGPEYRYLHAFLGGPVAHEGQPAWPASPVDEIAIVGMAARLPGAPDLDTYWRNLSQGVRSLTAPPARAGTGPAGGFLQDVESFDSLLFHIAPNDVADLDPQLRLLMHTVWECLEHAGHVPASLGRVGVFLGAMWQDHQRVGTQRWDGGQPATVSATASDAANRISHYFGFRGPSVAVDTSCSSSLAALHLAAEALRSGECDSAIVAAVNLLTHPYHMSLLRDLGLLATRVPDGAFDAAMPGWLPGEGVAAVLLRRNSTALGDADTVHGILEHTAIGHVGGGGRFAAPNARSLAEALSAALTTARMSSHDIGYVECAAAGATLSDAAELEALREVFAGRNAPLPVGTVKPNIGHLEAAAGLSQLAKVLLQLGQGRFAPTVLSGQPSPLVTFDGLRPVQRLTEWEGPRRALINAVGATGTYGLAIVRAGDVPHDRQSSDGRARTVTLSAETHEQLAAMAERLLGHVTEHRPALADVAFTLHNGRTTLTHRVDITCADIGGLQEALVAFGRGEPHPALSAQPVNANGGGRRIPLPTYPFEAARQPGSDETLGYLTRLYAELSGIPAQRLHPRVPLESYGLTSALIAHLNARIEQDFGKHAPVSKTLFFEHPDLAGVAGELARHGTATSQAPSGGALPGSGDERIAVIGMAGRYPQAADVHDFWQLLVSGTDAITELPPSRHFPGTDPALMVGGFVDGVDEFDPLFFGITPREAALMDPQERLFLQVAWHAVEDAGYPRTRLRARHDGRVGVFVGAMYNEYPFFGLGTGTPSGSAIAGIANRVSYFLDLSGPSFTVDTMCSSSLTAIHLAVASLRRGECAAAIVGGVNLSLHRNKFEQLRELKMASSDHRCRSFGAGGDGFVPGEGVGAVLLKPFADAVRDGDRIQAVITGTAINHDGKTNGYTVPNPVAQGNLVAQALQDAASLPSTIGYVEAHGTGTSLGDPVEINGLARAYGGLAPGTCAIGSVKSNIGHLEAAAGIAGLTKVILQFHHRTLVPSLHSDQLNPNIDWAGVAFRVQREAQTWPAEVPRRAGISSFGAGGANAHVVVEAFDPAPAAEGHSGGPCLVLLSARTEDQLKQQIERLVAHVRRGGATLTDVAYTLHVGREALKERLALVAHDIGDLCARLERGDFHRGRASADIPASSPGTLEDQARHWVRGGEIPAPQRPGRIVELPGYPFARQRCWIGEAQQRPDSAVPLYVRDWEPAPAAPRERKAGTAVLLSRPDQHELAVRIAAELDEVTFLHNPSAVPDGQVNGWLDITSVGSDGDGDWMSRLELLRRILSRRPTGGVRVMQVTDGLFDGRSLAGARLAGFVRALGAEYPWVHGTVVETGAGQAFAGQVADEWRARQAWSEILVRNGVRSRRALVAVPDARSRLVVDPERVYVITGASGALGALVARHLAARGATRFALMGHGRVPEAVANSLSYAGPLTNRAAVAAFLSRVRAELGDIAGVVHCAGRGADGSRTLLGMDTERIRETLEPKCDGLEVLADLIGVAGLDFFLLFSSVASAVPALGAGMLDYSAANAYLDYFAGYHRHRGRTAVRVVNWPVWRESGTGKGAAATAKLGLDPLSDAEGLSIMDAVLAMAEGRPILPAKGAVDPAILLAVHEPPKDPVPTVEAPSGGLAEIFAGALGIALPELDPQETFGNLGVESVLLAELVEKIERLLGRPVEPATLLEHDTLEKLQAHLGIEPERAPPPPEVTPERPAQTGQKIAVIGMACRFPGAPDIAAFWRLLRDSECAVTEVPSSRWDAGSLYEPGAHGKSVSKWGGFVTGLEDFDPGYFGLGDDEAKNLDPAIRLTLEATAACLRDAGYTDDEVRGRDVGVFVGARMSQYRKRIGIDSAATALGGDQNFIAARIAHQFDLRGPNLIADSACSSSLVSVQLACQSLLSGESELALAAGVDILLDEEPYLEFSAAKALSPRGRCATFDRDADGFVPGEGCGMLLLKPLEKAIRDGDRIRGVIDAVAVGNDGRTMGLTTPNPAAQAAVVARALERAGVRADEVGMLEAHGTATMIGDPIELRALTEAYRRHTDRTGFCAIGSVKSNLGHLFSASGMAGLIKALLALENGEIPATLFCDNPNPRFDFAASPFFPNTGLRRWAEGRRRIAGVSAFGLGGTNAHAIVSEFTPLPGYVQRRPLPAPDLQRRRLWWDRPSPMQEAAPKPSRALELRFS